LYGGRGLFYEDTHGCFVAETGTDGYGVLKMEFGAIVSAEGGSEASLGVAGVALAKLSFGEEGDAHARWQAQRY
jgi:hypothetical protein